MRIILVSMLCVPLSSALLRVAYVVRVQKEARGKAPWDELTERLQ
jgi:energy-converting hydrogenase Eha subunit C